ncbi:hypothetical protein J7E73_03105 [Paenibacillus albidus]|uniref:hypothetical protein n=1 Tax=Paenibacillus albidus TaxID=2041023 RepID=UPI001BE7375D|nr:hypothetical protein [Paenibacillus albidus]MBT2288133.1 hypothetical protein [Paenibacillus albidus]
MNKLHKGESGMTHKEISAGGVGDGRRDSAARNSRGNGGTNHSYANNLHILRQALSLLSIEV